MSELSRSPRAWSRRTVVGLGPDPEFNISQLMTANRTRPVSLLPADQVVGVQEPATGDSSAFSGYGNSGPVTPLP